MSVFISYAGEDEVVAREVADALEARGLEVFLASRKLGAGDSIPRGIEAALDAATVFLLLWSASSRLSGHVKGEREAALFAMERGDDLRFVVGRLDDTQLPRMLGHRLCLDLRDPSRRREALVRAPWELPSTGEIVDIDDVVIDRPRLLDEIVRHLDRGSALVVLGADGTGATTLSEQLLGRLRRERPQWRVVELFGLPNPGERDDDFESRVRSELAPRRGQEKTIAVVHGWERRPSSEDHQLALGRALRAGKEQRTLSFVALGGYALARLV